MIRQRRQFAVHSVSLSVVTLSEAIGMEPDASAVRGSRRAHPPVPVTNVWRIGPSDTNGRVDDQIEEIMTRLEHRVDALAALSARLRSDPREKTYGGLVVSVARHFDDPDGVEEVGEIADGRWAKLPSQHQLLGWLAPRRPDARLHAPGWRRA
jgi:hypothetical protein